VERSSDENFSIFDVLLEVRVSSFLRVGNLLSEIEEMKGGQRGQRRVGRGHRIGRKWRCPSENNTQ